MLKSSFDVYWDTLFKEYVPGKVTDAEKYVREISDFAGYSYNLNTRESEKVQKIEFGTLEFLKFDIKNIRRVIYEQNRTINVEIWNGPEWTWSGKRHTKLFRWYIRGLFDLIGYSFDENDSSPIIEFAKTNVQGLYDVTETRRLRRIFKRALKLVYFLRRSIEEIYRLTNFDTWLHFQLYDMEIGHFLLELRRYILEITRVVERNKPVIRIKQGNKEFFWSKLDKHDLEYLSILSRYIRN